ncbi:MAG: hypothetical protein V2A73_21750 [Pseudomonadota bacterium]
MRYVGERKACAAIILAFFGLLFLLNAIAGPAATAPMFAGLALRYLVSFFGLVAGWFWARWYTLGLAVSGIMTAALLLWQVGAEPVVLVWGVGHSLVGLALLGMGPTMAFDGRRDWRERWKMSEESTERLGKAIRRAGASLPCLIVAGLAPRGGHQVLGVLALVGGMAGLLALLAFRTWGVVVLGAAALLVLAVDPVPVLAAGMPVPAGMAAPCLGAAMLVLAIAPFVFPIGRFLRSRGASPASPTKTATRPTAAQ